MNTASRAIMAVVLAFQLGNYGPKLMITLNS